MLAGPHEKTMDEAIQNLDEMLKLDADYAVFAVFSPYPGTDSFAEGAKKNLYAADCWDRLMKDPLCEVEVPVCWDEHLSKAEILAIESGVPHKIGLIYCKTAERTSDFLRI